MSLFSYKGNRNKAQDLQAFRDVSKTKSCIVGCMSLCQSSANLIQLCLNTRETVLLHVSDVIQKYAAYIHNTQYTHTHTHSHAHIQFTLKDNAHSHTHTHTHNHTHARTHTQFTPTDIGHSKR